VSDTLIRWECFKDIFEIADRAIVKCRTGEPAADMIIESLEKRLNASADVVDSLRAQLTARTQEMERLWERERHIWRRE
jgi:hypothetical protein